MLRELYRSLYKHFNLNNKFRSQPWSRGNIKRVRFDPGRVSFSSWGFFRGFSSTVRQMSGKSRPHPSPDNIGHHNHKYFITGANDLRCWRALKPRITYYTIIGVKCDWDFLISDLFKIPDGTDIYLSSVVIFGEVRRAQLAKSILLSSTMMPLWSFQNF